MIVGLALLNAAPALGVPLTYGGLTYERSGAALTTWIVGRGYVRIAVRSPAGRWGRSQKVPRDPGSDASPQLGLVNGRVRYLVWSSNAPSGRKHLLLSTRTAAGHWAQPRVIPHTAGVFPGDWGAVGDAHGQLVLIYFHANESGPSNTQAILTQAYAHGRWTAPRTIDLTPPQDGTLLRVAGLHVLSDPQGDIVTWWADQYVALGGPTTTNRITTIRRTPDGHWQTATPVPGSATGSLDPGPVAFDAALANGTLTAVVAVYRGSTDDVVAAQQTAAGWSTPQTMQSAVNALTNVYDPYVSVAAAPDGSAQAAFTGYYTQGSSMAVQAFSGGFGNFSSPETVALIPGFVSLPRIVVSRTGLTLALWVPLHGPVQTATAINGSWTPPLPLPNVCADPTLSADPNGLITILSYCGNDLASARTSSDGRFGASTLLR